MANTVLEKCYAAIMYIKCKKNCFFETEVGQA